MMAPSNIKREDLREEDRVVAVLIAEEFNDHFQPLSKYEPLALLSLVNSPLLDYSLDWLQRWEIDETIVYCCAQPHSEKIRDHCKQWSLRFGNVMKVHVISSENCGSVGDAMRDLYSKSLLKKDFLLITGAVIGNFNLKLIMKKHKAAHKKNPNCVMSCVYLKGKGQTKMVDSSRFVNLIINSKTGKIHSHSRVVKSSKLALPSEVMDCAPFMEAMPSLEDPSIAVCSEMIPPLFSDNFDYGTRDSLVTGIIEQEDLLGCTVNAVLLEEGYASSVSSFKSYEEVSNDVMSRKAFPSVPERSLSSQRIRYMFQPYSSIYWDSSSKFHKKSLGESVVIDAGTEIDQRCRIRNSVVGKHCDIKENVTICDSFLSSNASVNKGCILDTCFLGDSVKLLAGVHLEPGVVLGPKTVLGPNLKVNRCNRLMHEPRDARGEALNPLVCGKEGCAFMCATPQDETDAALCTPSASQWGEVESVGARSQDSDAFCSDESDDEDDDEGGAEGDRAVSSDEEREMEFETEVRDSLLNAYCQKSALENVILEVNSSRHAYNVTMENVLSTVTKACLHVVEESGETRLTGEKLWQSIKLGLETFADIIKNYIKKVKDQMVVLKVLEDTVSDERFLPALQHILYEMSQELDILDDEVIIFWYTKSDFENKGNPKIAKSLSKFMQWLNERDEDQTDSDGS